jgi:hypothetical protein
LRDHWVEVLLQAVETTEEKAHAHDQEEVGQHTADQGCLHNEHLIIDQGNDGDN